MLPSFATVLSDSVSTRPSPPIETQIDSPSSEHHVSSPSSSSRPPSASHHHQHQHQHPHHHHPYQQQQQSRFYTLPPLENIDTRAPQRSSSRSPGRPYRSRPHSNSVSAVESSSSTSFQLGKKRSHEVASRPDMFPPFETPTLFSASTRDPNLPNGPPPGSSQSRFSNNTEHSHSSADATDSNSMDHLRYVPHPPPHFFVAARPRYNIF